MHSQSQKSLKEIKGARKAPWPPCFSGIGAEKPLSLHTIKYSLLALIMRLRSMGEKLNATFKNPQRETAGHSSANSFIPEAEAKRIRLTMTTGTSCAENCQATKQDWLLAMENRWKTVSVTDRWEAIVVSSLGLNLCFHSASWLWTWCSESLPW